MKKIFFYYYALFIYVCLNLVFLFNFFMIHVNLPIINYILIVFLLLILPIVIYIGFSEAIYGYKKGKDSFFGNPLFKVEEKFSKKAAILLKILNIIYGIIAITGIVSILITIGVPEKIDDAYYLVSHGDIIKEISYKEYLFKLLTSRQVFVSFMIIITQMAVVRLKRGNANNDF